MSNTLDKIINTVTANGMREITVERAKQIAVEYATQVPDRESEMIEMLEKCQIQSIVDENKLLEEEIDSLLQSLKQTK